MGKTLKVSVIGLGKMGIAHSVILAGLNDIKVQSLCENQSLINAIARKLLPKISFYTDYREMLSKEILDAVFVTTPIHTHKTIVNNILKIHPVHLFVEKPLARDFAEAEALAIQANSLGIINFVGFQRRYNDIFQAGKRAIDSGVLGKIEFYQGYSFSSDILAPAKGWRFQKGSGGALIEMGPHLIDLVNWYFEEPEVTAAIIKRLYSLEVDDFAHTDFKHPGGIRGSVEISWSMKEYRLPEILINVYGTDGEMSVNDDNLKLRLNKSTDVIIPGKTLEAGEHILYHHHFKPSNTILYADPDLVNEDEDFINAIKQGKASGVTFESAARVNRVIDHIYELNLNRFVGG